MKKLNRLDPFEEEIWDNDYKPSLKKEPEWISTGWYLGTFNSNIFWETIETTRTSRLQRQKLDVPSTFGKKVKIRRKGPQPKYKSFPVKSDSRSEFIKKDRYGR